MTEIVIGRQRWKVKRRCANWISHARQKVADAQAQKQTIVTALQYLLPVDQRNYNNGKINEYHEENDGKSNGHKPDRRHSS